MISGYTIFITYGLESVPYDATIGDSSLGYSSSIHCNYIQKRVVDTTTNKNVNMYFTSPSQFKFLAGDQVIIGTGWTANKIYMLLQIVDNSTFSSLDAVVPSSNQWKKFDVSDQIAGYAPGNTSITINQITSTAFLVPLSLYSSAPYYNLSYLNYPLTTQPDLMGFGEETYFMGNVATEIQAIAYTTDIAINLPLNQFNSSTNATWDGISTVQISEIGIYDVNGNLVAIGKLNDPIGKDSTIGRTLVFGIDF